MAGGDVKRQRLAIAWSVTCTLCLRAAGDKAPVGHDGRRNHLRDAGWRWYGYGVSRGWCCPTCATTAGKPAWQEATQ